ncbi:MAG TPA: phosphoglycerate kinase [Flavobacteriales bacterium]|nr:phosphoglycerate kinase [Flavobacteriales bacterium]
MKTIDNYNFNGKRVLIRVDFNVPLNDKFEITDDTRIKAAVPTIKKILADGGCVVLMSHLGRPKEKPEEKYSLKHLVKHLSAVLDVDVKFADDCISEDAFKKSTALKRGEVLLLENLRFYKAEEKGDEEFAKKLSGHGQVYVNDAFGTAHRAHASTTVVAKFFPNDKMFGYVMAGEINSINKVLNHADKPFTAIIGGAKVSDKILIIEQLLDKVTDIIVGGGMAYTFAKALGGKIGNSLCEDDRLETALTLLETAKQKNVNIQLPVDTKTADKFDNAAKTGTAPMDAIPEGTMGLDIGPESIKKFTEIIKRSKTILWNGPMGVFEMSNFEEGTKQVAHAVADATSQGAYTLIGGGDSVAAINKYKLADKVSYVSTGGGALLEYIENGSLVGVEAVLK